MRELALFAGAGGGLLGSQLLGWRTRCAVEIDPWCRKILLQRQADGFLPGFPIWDDVRTFEGQQWRYQVDIITGGFPCQDVSAAGKGAGLEGKRSGLWSEMARIIGEVGPRYVFVENSPMLTGRGLDRVLMDLAKMGYDAVWGVFGAHTIGAPHKRDRIWIVANSRCGRQRGEDIWEIQQPGGAGTECTGEVVADADRERFEKRNIATKSDKTRQHPRCITAVGRNIWWDVEPGMGRVANGVANRVDRLKALGNGQVPGVAALAWSLLTSDL